jgi:uncharacterized damage-inducible protein DinB
MTHKENWLEKTFDFDFPSSKYVEFLDILRQTPDRLETLVDSLPSEVLTRRDDDSWSIQENVGHFLASESLFTGRLDDYLNGAEVLRPARFEDNPTDKANFNKQDIHKILGAFRHERTTYIQRLDALLPDDFAMQALHPRLNKPMRICDMLLFHAEHDKHHLARIEELKDKL